MSMSHQDWTPVIWKKKPDPKLLPKTVVVVNKQKNINSINNTVKKIYDEDNPNAEPKIQPVLVDRIFSKELQSRRLLKKISQQDLAKALSIPVAIISEYEKGTGIRNGTYISKIKKYLNF